MRYSLFIFQYIANFIPKIYNNSFRDELHTIATKRISWPVPSYWLEIQSSAQTRIRKILLVILLLSRVKMGINLATNQRVAIKIMNQKIDEIELERGY